MSFSDCFSLWHSNQKVFYSILQRWCPCLRLAYCIDTSPLMSCTHANKHVRELTDTLTHEMNRIETVGKTHKINPMWTRMWASAVARKAARQQIDEFPAVTDNDTYICEHAYYLISYLNFVNMIINVACHSTLWHERRGQFKSVSHKKVPRFLLLSYILFNPALPARPLLNLLTKKLPFRPQKVSSKRPGFLFEPKSLYI